MADMNGIKVMAHADGGLVWTWCSEHGANVKVDEDGLCVGCGAGALFRGEHDADPSEDADAMSDARDDADVCEVENVDRFICTRSKGHDGRHVASNGTDIVARWP